MLLIKKQSPKTRVYIMIIWRWLSYRAVWPSGLRRMTRNHISSDACVRITPLSFPSLVFFHYLSHLALTQ